jgi:hypothetical protein
LLKGVHWAVTERQLRGCRGGRWVAWGGIQCERCARWRGLCNGVIAWAGALAVRERQLWGAERGRALDYVWQD